MAGVDEMSFRFYRVARSHGCPFYRGPWRACAAGLPRYCSCSRSGVARRAVVRLGIPALIVAALAVAAVWRVGLPPQQKANPAVATTGTSPAKAITEPVKTVAELVSNNAIGREASVEHVRIRER